MEKLARIFGIEIGNDRSEFSNIEFTRSRYFQCKRIAITGRRLTPAYLSLDYNPPYDVAFITLKYAHRHCAIYARTRSRACTRQGKKEKRTKKKKREVKREKKNRLIRNRGQHVTMTLILVIFTDDRRHFTRGSPRGSMQLCPDYRERDTVESTE